MKDKRYGIDYLEDILDAISKIHNFTIGLSEQEFLELEKHLKKFQTISRLSTTKFHGEKCQD